MTTVWVDGWPFYIPDTSAGGRLPVPLPAEAPQAADLPGG